MKLTGTTSRQLAGPRSCRLQQPRFGSGPEFSPEPTFQPWLLWPARPWSATSCRELTRERGSVLVIVLWISFGLVALALYFAHAMTMTLRASDNRVAGLEAEQAIEGAARYVSNIVFLELTNLDILPGMLPDPMTYATEEVPVGDATFWLLGRETNSLASGPVTPVFGLVDEASKLNLNTVSFDILQYLPGMTPELAAAIVDWRDTDSDVNENGGAEEETYSRLPVPYLCKNGPFESVDELRLVYGMTLDVLYGEDANLNGILDLNEDDADLSLPLDNRDGRLDPGLFEYLTIYTMQPNTGTNVNDSQQLRTLLQDRFGDSRATEVLSRLGVSGGGGGGGGGGQGGAGGGGGTTGQTLNLTSLLQFYNRSGLTAEEFAQIEGDICITNTPTPGLVNVNTASEAVLAAILAGLGNDPNLATALVAYRQSNPGRLYSIAWVTEALNRDETLINQLGPYITGRSFQFSADIVALGHYQRGYRRVKYTFDVSSSTPTIIARQDLTSLGWALGSEVRQSLQLARQTQ